MSDAWNKHVIMFVACYWHLQVFLKILLINTSLFSRKMLKKWKKGEHFGNFWLKRKLVNVRSVNKYDIMFVAWYWHLPVFFLKILLINTSLFSRKMLIKWKKSEHFGNFWFKKKTGKCQKHETNMIMFAACYWHLPVFFWKFYS